MSWTNDEIRVTRRKRLNLHSKMYLLLFIQHLVDNCEIMLNVCNHRQNTHSYTHYILALREWVNLINTNSRWTEGIWMWTMRHFYYFFVFCSYCFFIFIFASCTFLAVASSRCIFHRVYRVKYIIFPYFNSLCSWYSRTLFSTCLKNRRRHICL